MDDFGEVIGICFAAEIISIADELAALF